MVPLSVAACGLSESATRIMLESVVTTLPKESSTATSNAGESGALTTPDDGWARMASAAAAAGVTEIGPVVADASAPSEAVSV